MFRHGGTWWKIHLDCAPNRSRRAVYPNFLAFFSDRAHIQTATLF